MFISCQKGRCALKFFGQGRVYSGAKKLNFELKHSQGISVMYGAYIKSLDE